MGAVTRSSVGSRGSRMRGATTGRPGANGQTPGVAYSGLTGWSDGQYGRSRFGSDPIW